MLTLFAENSYPGVAFLRTLVSGIIDITNSKGDKASPSKIPLLILTSPITSFQLSTSSSSPLVAFEHSDLPFEHSDLPYILNNTGYGYKIHDININHLFYMDHLKLLAKMRIF